MIQHIFITHLLTGELSWLKNKSRWLVKELCILGSMQCTGESELFYKHAVTILLLNVYAIKPPREVTQCSGGFRGTKTSHSKLTQLLSM